MKKQFKLIAFFVLLTFVSFAQNDSTTVQLNSGIENILNSIIEILPLFGLSVPAKTATICVSIIMFIVRFIEKKRDKKKVATEIKTIVNGSIMQPSDDHYNKFQKLIRKLEGKKDQPEIKK